MRISTVVPGTIKGSIPFRVESELAEADHFEHSSSGVGNVRQTIPKERSFIRGNVPKVKS